MHWTSTFKLKTECPYCGVTNTEINVTGYGDNTQGFPEVFSIQCWHCGQYFVRNDRELKEFSAE
jgi:hypothetical protein